MAGAHTCVRLFLPAISLKKDAHLLYKFQIRASPGLPRAAALPRRAITKRKASYSVRTGPMFHSTHCLWTSQSLQQPFDHPNYPSRRPEQRLHFKMIILCVNHCVRGSVNFWDAEPQRLLTFECLSITLMEFSTGVECIRVFHNVMLKS